MTRAFWTEEGLSFTFPCESYLRIGVLSVLTNVVFTRISSGKLQTLMFRSIANASWRAFSAGTRPSFHKFKTEIPRLSISTQLNLRAGFATQHPRREDLCDEKPMIGPGEELAFAWITPRSLIKVSGKLVT